MKVFLKKYWRTLLFFMAAGLIGGYPVGVYMLQSYPEALRLQIQAQGLNESMVGILTAVQYAWYGLVVGGGGIWLGKKTGLWKGERHIAAKPLAVTMVIGVISGLLLILADVLFFGKYSQAIMDSYAVKPDFGYVLGVIVLGGVTEEVMLRLFVMSLAAFVLHALFEKKQEFVGTKVMIAANVVAALLFAAGHLPANQMLFGLTPMIVFRCFLLNGGFGLLFGWLYRRYGLRYAMIAHGGCHVVSKLIWILFI